MSDQTSQDEGVAGVGMLLAAYVDEGAADQTLNAMYDAEKQGTFYFDDAAVIRQDRNGQVHIKETGDMSTGKGARIGAFVGGVIGLLGGPAGVALGAGAGAAIGGISSHHDGGFSQESLKEIGGALTAGHIGHCSDHQQSVCGRSTQTDASSGDHFPCQRPGQ